MDVLEQRIAILQAERRNACVFIAGFGGSGKTTLCERLQKRFPNSVHVLSDWFLAMETEFRKRHIAKVRLSKDTKKIEQIENPCHWYDWDLFRTQLTALKNEGELALPQAWNQRTGKKDLSIRLTLDNFQTLIFCDGIYLLQDEVKDLGDFKIWIDTPPNVCRERYFQRDNHRSSKEYLEQKWVWFEKYDLPLLETFQANADFTLTP